MAAVLGLCARTHGSPAAYCRLVVETDDFEAWSRLPDQAEKHGLGPLVYTHFKAINALVPAEVGISLKGLALRHRRANAVLTTMLAEILNQLYCAGIPVLVLKGAALAYLVYPRPELRPMRDLDLLVRPEDTPRARAVLHQIGFRVAAARDFVLPAGHHHLPAFEMVQNGETVSVELHTAVFPRTRFYTPLHFDDLQSRSIAF